MLRALHHQQAWSSRNKLCYKKASRRGEIRALNTFLPYPDFQESVRVLDRKRLGKQRVEAFQILNIVSSPSPPLASATTTRRRSWVHAPAVRMWMGYPYALALYYNLCLQEWHGRGYKNILLKPSPLGDPSSMSVIMPPWFGNDAFHASHRSNLLHKLPEHYSQFLWTEPPDLPYVWPVPLVKGKTKDALQV